MKEKAPDNEESPSKLHKKVCIECGLEYNGRGVISLCSARCRRISSNKKANLSTARPSKIGLDHKWRFT